MGKFEDLRKQMIVYQLAARGLHDPTVVEFSYSDSALPIAASQTISQPYIVALMTAALELKPHELALEVATGSGYAAAVLAEIAEQVYSIERHKILADTARRRLESLGYKNIQVLYGNASLPNQFDEYIWFDETRTVDPLRKRTMTGMHDTFPFGF